MPDPKHNATGAARQAAFRARREQARQGQLLAKGLPSLPVIPTMPGWPRWNASFCGADELLACSLSEMQNYYDERTENWRESERGEQFQEKIVLVEEVIDALRELTS